MLPLNYAILDYQSIELPCFHYNGSAGVSFLLQQCLSLDDFSEGHSEYWTFRLLDYQTIGHSDYQAFELSDLWTIGPSYYWAFGLSG
jgi:hypothetical protein